VSAEKVSFSNLENPPKSGKLLPRLPLKKKELPKNSPLSTDFIVF